MSPRRPAGAAAGAGGLALCLALSGCTIELLREDCDTGAAGAATTAGPTAAAGRSWAAVAVGGLFSCGRETDGSVACWGAPTGAADPSPARAIFAGYDHQCAILDDGSLDCGGRDDDGQATVPADLAAPGALATADGAGRPEGVLALGGAHSCATAADGTARCWGRDTAGQATVPSTLGLVAQLAAGWRTSCALGVDGALACWGADELGQAQPPAGDFTAVALGQDHGCGVTAAGALACWGADIPAVTGAPGGTDWTGVAAGVDFGCARSSAGAVRCGGADDVGQTDGPTGTGWEQVVSHAAARHACAVHGDGRLVCWGADEWGQALGD